MKNGLPIKPLQTLCEDFKQDIVDGPFGSELQRKDYITKGVPVLKIQNVKPFAIELKKMDYVSPAKFQELRRHSYRSGDIVMTKLGSPLGVSAIVEDLDEGVIVADLVRIRAQRINTKYLCYHLNSQRTNDFINSMQKGTTRPRVTLSVVRELPIYAPPLPEQQRIVGILDEAFEGLATAKANAEKNLQNARALFDSHLQSVFTQCGKGWVEKPLSAVCDLQNGYAFKSGDYIESSNTLNIRMSSIRPGGSFDPEHNQRFLPDSYAEEYAAFLLNEGDLIIAMTDMAGDPKILGVPTLVNNLNGRNFLMNQRVGKLFGFADNVHVPYLRYFLTSPSIKLFYKSKGAGGLQINISKGDILSALIPLPRIAEQEIIAAQLNALFEETQRLESLYQQKLAALEELKKSLLHQAFTGAL